MISKIKINELNNDLYSLKETLNKNIYFVLPESYSSYSSYSSITSPEIVSPILKDIKLNKFVFYVEKKIGINYEILGVIKNELNNEFIKNILELGKQNREISKYFDIDNINITETEIDSKLNQINYIIFNNSNVWLLSNIQTYNHIYDKLKNNYSTAIDNMTCIMNDLVEDGMFLIGQKSDSAICYILTDNNGNIVFEQRENDYKVELTMYFAFVNNTIESKYYYVSTRDIRYYRKKKLQKIQKIRESYGKN